MTTREIEIDSWVHANYNKAFILLHDVDKIHFSGSYLAGIMKNPCLKRDYGIRLDYDRKKTDMAILVLTELLSEIENEHAYHLRAEAYFAKKEYKNAIDDFSEALKINSHVSLIYNNRGVTYSQMGEVALALDDYNSAIKIDSDDHVPYYNRGQSRFVLNEYEGALDDYNKALEIDPKDADVLHARALLKEKCGDYKGAVSDVTEAINSFQIDHYEDPFSFYAISEESYRLRAKCHKQNGNENSSKADLEKCMYYLGLMNQYS